MRMVENQTLNGNYAYTLILIMCDLRNGIWTELRYNRSIDTYKKNTKIPY